jgi:hypothetical protein
MSGVRFKLALSIVDGSVKILFVNRNELLSISSAGVTPVAVFSAGVTPVASSGEGAVSTVHQQCSCNQTALWDERVLTCAIC